MSKRVRLGLAMTLGSALLLSGCGQSDIAAKVGDRVIGEDAARVAAEQIRANFQGAENFGTTEAVIGLISAPGIIAAGEKAGVPFSEQAARAAFSKTDANPEAIELVRANAIYPQLEQADPAALATVTSELLKTKVTLNPRYGKWNPKTGETLPSPANWIKAAS